MIRTSGTTMGGRVNGGKQGNGRKSDEVRRSCETGSIDVESPPATSRLPRTSESTNDDVFFNNEPRPTTSTANLRQSRPPSCAIPVTNSALYTSNDSILVQVQRSAKKQPPKVAREPQIFDGAASTKSSRPVSMALSVVSAASKWDSVESSSTELNRGGRNGSRRSSKRPNSKSHMNISSIPSNPNLENSVASNSAVNVNSIGGSGPNRRSFRNRSHSRESSLTRLSSFLRESFRKLRRSRSTSSFKGGSGLALNGSTNLVATVTELNATVGGLERQRSIARLAGNFIVRSRSPSPTQTGSTVALSYSQRAFSNMNMEGPNAASISATVMSMNGGYSVQHLNANIANEGRQSHNATLPRKNDQVSVSTAKPANKQAVKTQPIAAAPAVGSNTLPRSTSKLANPKILATRDQEPVVVAYQPTLTQGPSNYQRASNYAHHYGHVSIHEPPSAYGNAAPLSPHRPAPAEAIEDQLMRAFSTLETIVRSAAQRNGAKRLMVAETRQQLALGKDRFRVRLRDGTEKRATHIGVLRRTPTDSTPSASSKKHKRNSMPQQTFVTGSNDRYSADTTPNTALAQNNRAPHPSFAKKHTQGASAQAQPKLFEFSKQLVIFRRTPREPQPQLQSQTTQMLPQEQEVAAQPNGVTAEGRISEASRPLRNTKSVSDAVYDNLIGSRAVATGWTPQRPITVAIPANVKPTAAAPAPAPAPVTEDRLLATAPRVSESEKSSTSAPVLKPKVASVNTHMQQPSKPPVNAVSRRESVSAVESVPQRRPDSAASAGLVCDRKISSQIVPKVDPKATVSVHKPEDARAPVFVKPILSFPLGRRSPVSVNNVLPAAAQTPSVTTPPVSPTSPLPPVPVTDAYSHASRAPVAFTQSQPSGQPQRNPHSSAHYSVPKGELVAKLKQEARESRKALVKAQLSEQSSHGGREEYVNFEAVSLTVSVSPTAGCATFSEFESPRCDDEAGITHGRMSSSTSSGVSSNSVRHNDCNSAENKSETESETETESDCDAQPAVDDSTLKKKERSEASETARRICLRKAASWPSLMRRIILSDSIRLRRSRSCPLGRFAHFAFSYDKRRSTYSSSG